MVDAMNGVDRVQNATQLQVQSGQERQDTSIVIIQGKADTAGKGTQVQTQTDFNLYGKDIANFETFKGNDKSDAMRMTQTAAKDVKKAYMQLQHEFPDVVIQFEPMPDPKTCGKKREGFFNYQQQLDDWKDLAMELIANARETSTREGFEEVMAQGDNNTGFLAGLTISVGKDLKANMDESTAAILQGIQDGTAEIIGQIKDSEGNIKQTIRSAEGHLCQVVKNAKGEIINVVRYEGAITRQTEIEENSATRRTVQKEGEATRQTTRAEGEATRANNTRNADRVIDTLDPLGVARGTGVVRDAAGNLFDAAGNLISKAVDILNPFN